MFAKRKLKVSFFLFLDKGEILVWGSNREGQLGCEGEYKLTPTKLILGNKISSITCGYYHSLAITGNIINIARFFIYYSNELARNVKQFIVFRG